MIELISIGAELLSGSTVNTNASFIGQKLLSMGYCVDRITTLPDDRDAILSGVKEALERSSVVITTGGLGPTGDDITRSTLAELFEAELIYDSEVALDLKKRFGDKLETTKDQATVIKGATILRNPIGTAPGFILKKEGKAVFVLPGVPIQMQEMVNVYVIPYLKKEVPKQCFQHALYFCLLSEQKMDPLLRDLEKKYSGVEIGICPSYGVLSVYVNVKASSQDEANEIMRPAVAAIIEKFKPHLFSERTRQIEYAVYEALAREGKTLACAESCTGGSIASRLTQISGISDVFLGSIVSYSDHLKRTALKVTPETLEEHGAVSREVVIEMMRGTFELTGADYAIAVSGIAGPTGGTEEKPVGTIWGAIGINGGDIHVGQIPMKGGKRRDLIIDYSSTYLLSSLWQLVHRDIIPFGGS